MTRLLICEYYNKLLWLIFGIWKYNSLDTDYPFANGIMNICFQYSQPMDGIMSNCHGKSK